jgi:hypothetical protein
VSELKKTYSKGSPVQDSPVGASKDKLKQKIEKGYPLTKQKQKTITNPARARHPNPPPFFSG